MGRMDGAVNYVIGIIVAVVEVIWWDRMGLKCKRRFYEVMRQSKLAHVKGKKLINGTRQVVREWMMESKVICWGGGEYIPVGENKRGVEDDQKKF